MSDDLNAYGLSENAKDMLKDPSLLHEALKRGKRPQEILEFSDETMVEFYRTACLILKEGRSVESGAAFVFLTALNPDRHEYWLGLGMSRQLCRKYEEAIDAYELAAITDISAPLPYFYLAKCLFAIHDRTSALQALDLAVEMTEDREDLTELRQQAISAREILLKTGDV